MQRFISRHFQLLLLAGITVLTVGVALLYLYLCDTDSVGVWTSIASVLLELLILFPIFFGLGAAFRLTASGRLRAALSLLGLVLAACFLHQSVIAFFDYYLYSDFVAWAALLFGFFGGFISGALVSGLLIALLFAVPYFIFLRGEDQAERGVFYATVAATIGYLLYRLVQQTVSILVFLSEHLWVANRTEILTFALYYAFDLLLSAAALGFLCLGRRLSERFDWPIKAS